MDGTHSEAARRAEERIVPGTPHWEASYPDHIQRYRFAAGFVAPGSTVLDAGCGVGYGAALLADAQPDVRVVAVDIAADALALASTHFDRANITWCPDDCEVLSVAAPLGPFDVITNFENIEHLERPEALVARAAQLLAPTGVFLTSTPDRLLLNRLRGVPPDAPPSNPHHHREFSEAEFRALLEDSFGTVEMWYQWPVGRAGLGLRVRSAAARLRLRPALLAARGMLRRRRVVGRPARAGSAPDAWRIAREHPGRDLSWTLLAVCSAPRPGVPSAG